MAIALTALSLDQLPCVTHFIYTEKKNKMVLALTRLQPKSNIKQKIEVGNSSGEDNERLRRTLRGQGSKAAVPRCVGHCPSAPGKAGRCLFGNVTRDDGLRNSCCPEQEVTHSDMSWPGSQCGEEVWGSEEGVQALVQTW